MIKRQHLPKWPRKHFNFRRLHGLAQGSMVVQPPAK
jgi:hypothetical protein